MKSDTTLTVWLGCRKTFHTQPIPYLIAVQLANMLRALAEQFSLPLVVKFDHPSARYYRKEWKPYEKYGIQFFGKVHIDEPFVLTIE